MKYVTDTQPFIEFVHVIVTLCMYFQIIAKQFRQLNVYCRHLYFIKIGDELKCCVFISLECIALVPTSVTNFMFCTKIYALSKYIL